MRRVYQDDRQLKAVLGVSKADIDRLLPVFGLLLLERSKNKKRERAVGGGRKGVLSEALHKLIYILFYIKVYPTFDLAGFVFGAHRSRCCQWSIGLLPILEKALGRSVVMPKRKISSLEEFVTLFPNLRDLFVDGTERRVQRNKSYAKQAKKFSGKKRTHTRKNLVGCDSEGRILLISPTKGGRTHDLTCFKKWNVGNHFPEELALWGDKGFTGIQRCCKNRHFAIPHKKKKGISLTEKERAENKVISGLRIVVEHAIGKIKRFGCMTTVYRNKKGQDETMISVAAGICNLQLQTKIAA